MISKFKIILLSGKNSKLSAEIIYYLLKDSHKIKTYFKQSEFFNYLDMVSDDLLIFCFDLEESKDYVEKFKDIDEPYVVLNGGLEENKEDVDLLINNLSSNAQIYYNLDDESLKNTLAEKEAKKHSFAIKEKGTINIEGYAINGNTTFKLNYRGKVIPFMLKDIYDEREIYAVLNSILMAMNFGMNMVEISEKLREYRKN